MKIKFFLNKRIKLDHETKSPKVKKRFGRFSAMKRSRLMYDVSTKRLFNSIYIKQNYLCHRYAR
jgi:hypothetical protein